ncbi:MAG: hypothetical protein AAF636_27235, partial [Pseudomonadota bacterium]
DWAACQACLGARFGDATPAMTAIPLPRLFPTGKAITISAWAMRGEDGAPLPKTFAGREAEPGPAMWRHALACGDMAFAGGISTILSDGVVGAAGNHIAQTQQVMARIDTLMRDLGGRLQDVHKTNSYYVLNTVEEFNSNLQTRSDCFEKPGPGSVGLPLDSLAQPGQRIDVEAILVKDDKGALS